MSGSVTGLFNRVRGLLAILLAGLAVPAFAQNINENLSTVNTVNGAGEVNVVAAGGATTTITVTVRQNNNNVIPNASVILYTNPTCQPDVTIVPTDLLDACTPGISDPVLTDANGVATFTVSCSTIKSVTFIADATANNAVTIVDSAVVNFTIDPATSTVSAGTPQIVAGSGNTSTITVTLRDGANAVVPAQNVTLSANPSSGVTGTGTTATDANGVATFNVTSTSVAAVVFTATAQTGSQAVTQTATVTFTASPTNSSVVSNFATRVANSGTVATITVNVRDGAGSGNNVAGQTVTLAASPNTGVTGLGSAVTDASGNATFLVASTNVAAVTFSATISLGSVAITDTELVTFTVSPALSTVDTAASNVVAGGGATTTITVTLRDGAGTAVASQNLTLAATPNTGVTISGGGSGTTNGSGVATFTVSSTAVAAVTFSATAATGSTAITDTALVNFTISAANSSVDTNVATRVANSGTTATITVTLRDGANSTVAGQALTLSAAPSTGVTISGGGSGTTDGSGVATFTVSSTNVANVTFTATATLGSVAVTDTAQVAFTVSAATSTVNPTAATVVAGGGATTLIVVTLRDGGNNPVAGETATVTATPNTGVTFVSGNSAITNASGIATFTVSRTTVGDVTFSAVATVGTVSVTDTALGSFTVSASGSTCNETSASVPADGVSTTSVIVTLRDGVNNLVAGETVTLSAAPNTGVGFPSGNAGVSNASGQVTFTVNRTLAGAVTFTATAATGTTVITDTAQVTFSGAAAQLVFATQPPTPPQSGTAGSPLAPTVTVEIRDASNVLVTDFNSTVSLTLGANPGSATNPPVGSTVNAVGGVAAFPALAIDKPGQNYTLIASSGALTPVTSNAFNVTAANDLVAGTVLVNQNGSSVTAEVFYSILTSPIGAFRIRVGVDTTNDGNCSVDQVLADIDVTDPVKLSAGSSSVVSGDLAGSLSGLVQNGSRIVAQLDTLNTFTDEASESNNCATSVPLTVDLSAAQLVLVNGSTAGLTYTVSAPAPVAPYQITLRLGNAGGPILDQFTDSTNLTSGSYFVERNLITALRANGVASNAAVTIHATVDSGGAITEASETNNTISTTDTLRVDLVALNAAFASAPRGTPFNLVISYQVLFAEPSENFTIGVYASSVGDTSISASDVLLGERIAGIKTVGTQTITISRTVPTNSFSDDNFFIKVRVDDENAVAEGADEANNVFVRANISNDPTDSDGDGITNEEEARGFSVTSYGNGTSGRFDASGNAPVTVLSSAASADTDGDGISDFDEINTFARSANPDGSVKPTGTVIELLRASPGRANLRVFGPSVALTDLPATDFRRAAGTSFRPKSAWGVRTDPNNADTDGDGIGDADDPAPQVDPVKWGFPPTDPTVVSIKATIRTALGAGASDRAVEIEFQKRLINFDQDGDGFLEAPDANGDGIPDFTRYSEATLERVFNIDFSNNGSLDDGVDIGGLGRGEQDVIGDRNPTERFGSYRLRDASGNLGGDGVLDSADQVNRSDGTVLQILIATDNCPSDANADQRDFDGDGLGDTCDADRDNDGVANVFDPVDQVPLSDEELAQLGCAAGLCGAGFVPMLPLTLAALVGLKLGRRRARR